MEVKALFFGGEAKHQTCNIKGTSCWEIELKPGIIEWQDSEHVYNPIYLQPESEKEYKEG